MSTEIVVTDEPGAAAQEVILAGLLAFNEARAPGAAYRPLAVLVKDEAGAVLGGLAGSTAWRWLYVHLLFLPETLRRRGLGSEILARAEAEALARGCRAVWLDSFAFQAPGFYQRLGYRVFGTLDDYPPGHRRFFLQKDLGATACAP